MDAIRKWIRQATRRDRQRGSVLLFAVVVVLLLTMMGAAYLQMARVDRRATRAVDTRSQDVDGSIIRFIANILAADLLQDGAERYDYPWTNSDATFEVKDFLDPTAGPLGDAEGGEEDDMWLASTEPVFSGTDVDYWPHLSNLRGIWLDLRAGSLVTDTVNGQTVHYPDQAATTADSGAWGDTNIPYSVLDDGSADPLGADADGDGIADSRWTWAPLPSELGKTYVMAVRIIDNSALANLNVWTQTDAPGADESRWYWPAELDLGPAFDHWSASGVFDGIMSRRGLPSAPSFEDRYWFWLDGPRMGPVKYNDADDLPGEWDVIGTGSTPEDINGAPGSYERFGIIDEIELRWRNGINKSSDNIAPDSDSPLEYLDSTNFWRQDALETNYNDFGSHEQFFVHEPRKHFTTISGAGLRWKADLNQSSHARLADVAEDVAGVNVPASLPTQGAANATPAWSAEEFGRQFAATVADWRDYREDGDHRLPDNRLTRVGDRYGMEYLPFISEVYVQREYTTAQPAPDPMPWTSSGDAGYMIEIVNPFPVTIPLEGLTLWVTDGVDAVEWGDLRDLFDAEEMTENQMLRLYRADGPSFTTEPDDYALPDAPDWPEGGAFDSIAIELRAKVDGDDAADPVVYHRFAVKTMPETFTTPLVAPYDVATSALARVHAIGTGNGLNAMTVRAEDVVFDDPETADDEEDVAIVAGPTYGAFDGKWNEAMKGVAALDNRLSDAINVSDTPPYSSKEPFIIGNAGRIYRAGDIARMVFVGPTDDEPFPEMWNAATSVAEHMLDFDAAAIATGDDDERVNPAMRLLGRLTTLAPDNSKAWSLVPGTININTAPRRVMDWALPEFTNKGAILTEIIDYRDDLTGTLPATFRTARENPGFAYLGELGLVDLPSGDSFYDVNEYEPDTPAGSTDSYPDDLEGKTRGLASLNQVLTTRSDIFTAYVVVRAYPSDDFNTHDEEYRLIAVFDRSGVTEHRPMAKVLGVAVIRETD